MIERIYAIFVAGGSGTRMGTKTPKQFLELCGKPVLQRSIETFLEAVPGINVITVLPFEHMDEWKDMCFKYSLDCPQTLVEGGITRFHSVKNALAKVPDGSIVFIHDGVRPLISAELVRKMASMMNQDVRALIPVVPVVDTLKLKDRNGPDPDRSNIVAAQTPQVFLSQDIKEAYRLGYDTSFTDDASVAARKGIPLTFVQGERFNIKITTPEDLELATFLLSR